MLKTIHLLRKGLKSLLVLKRLSPALRLLMAALLVFGAVVPSAVRSVEAASPSSFEVDVNQQQMNFNTPVACTGNKNPSVYVSTWSVNDQCLYTNVFTGKDTSNATIQVDAVITVASMDARAHINVFDLPDSKYNGRFNPVIYTDGSGWTGYQGVNFNIQFYKHTSTISLATISQADPVKLLDFFMTVIDIDGSSASLTEYVEISGFQSYQVDKNTGLQTEKTTPGRVRFRGIPTSVDGLVFQSNDSVIAYYSDPIQSLNVVGGNTGPLGSAGSTSQRQFSYDFGASGGVTGSKFTNPVTHPTLSVAIDDGGAGRLYPNAGNSQLTAVPIYGVTTIGTGRTVTLVIKNGGGTTLGTVTAVVTADGAYRTTVNASSWSRGPITVTASGSNASGVAADPETASATMNRIPAASAQNATTAEDTAKSITLAGTDADGDTLTYEIVGGPQHGTLDAINGNTVTYTPSPNYNGTDAFTFIAKDGYETSVPAQVQVTVTPVNDTPVADAQQLSIPQNAPHTITLSGTDVDGDSLTYAIQNGPQHGTLGSINGSQVTYTPNAGYVGTDSFTFIAKDGKGGNSSPATVDLTITAVNRAPIADPQQVTVPEDMSLAISLTGSDADGDTITYSIVSGPQHGTLGSVNGSQVYYMPASNFNGADSFTFIANDGNGGISSPATVAITVTAVNDAPFAIAQQVTTDEDTSVAVTLDGTDVDGDPLTYEIADQPQHGTLGTINGSQVTYTPDPDYAGADSFTFVAKDGNGGESLPATVNITVTPVEDPPVANPQQLTTDEDTPVAISLVGTDPDGDSLTYTITSSPANGTLGALNGSDVTYTPNNGYSGADSFTFNVSDGKGNTSPDATVNITVASVNHAPVANAQQVTTDEDSPVAITLTGTDPDGDSLTYTITSHPANGTLDTLNGSVVTYTPNNGYTGADSFMFTVKDGGGKESAPVAVSITVNEVNHAPVANAQQVTTDEDTAVVITLTGTDVDGDTLTYEVKTAPQHGTLSAVNGTKVTYTPNAGYVGTDSFTFVAKDGNGGTSTPAAVGITVNHVNHAPVANAQQVTTDEDTAVVITLTGTDVDGDTLTYEVKTAPQHGTLGAVNGTKVTYTPNAGYVGTDSFTFVAKDGNGGTSTPATVGITVNHVNHAPVANAQQVTTDEDTTVVITLTGTDVDGDTLTYEVKTAPQHGTLSAVNGTKVTYTPNAGYVGTDSFTFVVKDGNGGISTPATVGITVNHVNHAPVANAQQVTTDQEIPVVITLTGSDAETSAGDLRYIVIDGPEHGQLSGTGSELTYTPSIGYTGTDRITFKVNDSELDSATAVVTIQVRPLTPLDGWVGSRAQGETSPYVIVTPGSPLKLSAVSALSADRVVATLNGVQVELTLVNAATAEADGKKIWSSTQFRLSDKLAAGDYKAAFVAYDQAGRVTQEEKAERRLEDNAYHVRTEIGLRGTITDQDTGRPIAGALVTLYDLTGTVRLGGPFTTGADGKYHFDTIRTGEYLIVVKSDGYGTRSNMIQALPADLTSTVIERDYELVRFNLDLSASPSAIVGDGVTTSKLTAVLTDKDGKPIAGVEVEFSAPRGSFVTGAPGIHLTQKATTNAQGVAVVSYRSDKIEGILSQSIPVTAKVDDQEHQLYAVEQVIVTFQPASIKGVVTNNADVDGDGHPDPVAGAIVRIVKDFDGDGVIDFSAEAVTGPDGSYTIAIPRGEEDYTVSITRTVTQGSQSKTVTIEQPARAGTVTGAGGEIFASKKTISGIINSKEPDGGILLAPPVASNLKVYLKDAQGHYVLDDATGKPLGFAVGADGVFTATNLSQGEYTLEVRFLNTDGQEIIVNERQDGSLPKVSVTVDGQLNIEEELIDPYGTITDSQSGKVIDGVHVVLYYADTQRNRDNGISPNTQVVLPILTGFAPNDNANPQSSDIYGKYAYMVFAHTDYYLVATKSGYDTYVSPTISVERAIVRHDIVMNRPVSPGGGIVTPPTTPTTPTESTVVATNVSVEQSVYPKESEVPVTVTYSVVSGSPDQGSVKLELPEGVQAVDLDGGTLEGSAIVWPASSKNGEFHPILKLPQIDGKERKIELISSYVNSKGEETGTASVIVSIVDGRHEHVRYIQGYPDQSFQPNRSLTRAELAAIMARLIGKYDGANPGYKDVDSSFWAYGYIQAVTEAGLFTGYEDNRFLPNKPVSRAELAVVMVRYLGLKAGTPVDIHFSDIRDHWATSSIEALYRNHMISGYENGTFKPSNSVKRVEAVTLINHMLFRGPLHDIEPTFPDVPANYWGFGHIEEASVSHESTYDEQGEEHYIARIEDQVK